MTVRGTTRWKHAIVQKKIINRDEGGDGTPTSSGTHYVMCAWSDCEKPGYELFKVRTRTHAGHIRDDDPWNSRFVHYVFCSEKCKQLWLDEVAKSHHYG